MKILFVCRGNVGRSQMAEVLFKQLNDRHEVLSAGTKVVSPTTGESRHGQLIKDTKGAEKVIQVLKEKDIDIAENSRTQLSPEQVDWADKIISMAEPQTVPDYLANSPKLTYWEIADPKDTTVEVHRETMNEIENKVKEFISQNNL